MGHVVDYLSSKGLSVRSANAGNVHLPCFWCGEDSRSRGRLYVLDDDSENAGAFFCFLCNERGGIGKIRKHFGDAPLNDPGIQTNEVHMQITSLATDFYAESLADREDVFRYLRKDRGLSLDTIIDAKLGWADGSFGKYAQGKFSEAQLQQSGLVKRDGRDFLINRITIPYMVNGNPVMIRGRAWGDSTQKYLTPPGQKSRLYNTDKIWDANTAVLCEGEFDALIAQQLGFNAVGCPGANVWQPNWNIYLETAKRIYVVFDNDSSGHVGAEKMAETLGAKARIVSLPEGSGDLSEWVSQGGTKESLEKIFLSTTRGMLKSPEDAAQAWKEVQKASGLQLGFDVIDRAIAPGLLDSQILMILAKTNAGKTVMVLNIIHNVLEQDPDARVLFFSLEQTEHEWFERARRIYRFHHLDASDEDCIRFYQNRFFIVDDNIVSLQQLRDCVDEFELEVGKKPDLVVIDYLGYWARSFKGETYQRLTDAIMSLKAFAKERRIKILIPNQVNRTAQFGQELALDSGRDGPAEETADHVLALWNPDDQTGKRIEERTGEVMLKILKSRHGGKGQQAQLRFARLSLALIPFGAPLATQAKDESFYATLMESWETAIWRHRTGIKTNSLARYTLPDGSLVDPELLGA